MYTNIRTAFILSLITNSVIIFFYNELFSAFNAINSKSAFIFWLMEVLLLSGILVYLNAVGKITFSRLASLRNALVFKGLSRTNKIIAVAALVFFVLPLLFLTVYSPPNNFDAHSYHLNRILIWTNNGNLDHFPTEHIQQLYLNVFAEYLVLDSVLLSGSDRFAGLIQFGSFIGSLAGTSLLAKKMGMKADGQLLAAAFLLTLPIGIFESTSTQVDYIACFFFITFVYFGFELLEKKTLLTLMAFLFSLIFGGFTKYTIFIFAIPFTLYFAFRLLNQYGFLYAIKVLTLAVVLMTFIFAPFFYRNYELFSNIMSPPEDTRFFTERLPVTKHSVLYTLSGTIKNAGLHFGLPNTGFNKFIEANINAVHQWMGVDINDLGLGLDHFAIRYSVHEDMVPNTIHFWLIGLATITLFFLRKNWNIKWLWILAVLGFVLFSTLLKFQLWSTRTHMPFFAMGGILVAYVYSKVLELKITWLIAPLMLLSSVFVFGNPNKALIPVGYFSKKMLGHVPVAICATDSTQEKMFQKYLKPYYIFSGNDKCHQLKEWPDYGKRLKIFTLLDKSGYYNEERFSTVFTMDRVKSYFLSHPDNYTNFKPLLDHIDGENKNIGVLFDRGNGFYHYWGAIATKLKNPGRMDYIRYKKEFLILKNVRKKFCYDYILGDNIHLLKSFMPKENIDTIYQMPMLYLVKLKNVSCRSEVY